MAEPLAPSFGTLGILLTLNAALFVGALVSIARTQHHTTGSQIVWALIVLVLPFIGAPAWFILGRRSHTTTPSSNSS